MSAYTRSPSTKGDALGNSTTIPKKSNSNKIAPNLLRKHAKPWMVIMGVILMIFVFLWHWWDKEIPSTPLNACSLVEGFNMVKSPSDWAIKYRDDIAYTMSFADLHNLFGSNNFAGGCPTVISGQDFFAFLTDRENDLLVLYGISKTFGVVTGIERANFFPHNNMSIETDKYTLIIKNFNAKFCWQDNHWSTGVINGTCDHSASAGSTKRPLTSIFGWGSAATWPASP